MKRNLKQTFELDEDDVKRIIENYLYETYGFPQEIIDVDIQVSSQLEGVGPMETMITRFRKVVATIKAEK